jgi:hypothetical protein
MFGNRSIEGIIRIWGTANNILEISWQKIENGHASSAPGWREARLECEVQETNFSTTEVRNYTRDKKET